MDENQMDMNDELMVDGNAVAGMLQDLFDREMTATPTECNNCGNVADLGAMMAFMEAPGAILRCPTCGHVVMRIVETPDAYYIDARGAVYLRLSRGDARG